MGCHPQNEGRSTATFVPVATSPSFSTNSGVPATSFQSGLAQAIPESQQNSIRRSALPLARLQCSPPTQSPILSSSPDSDTSHSVAPSIPANPVPPAPAGCSHPAVVFAPDALRLHDHPALHAALDEGHPSLATVLLTSQSDTCAFRLAAAALRRSLRSMGTDLVLSPLSTPAPTFAQEARAVVALCLRIGARKLYTHTGSGALRMRHAALAAACESEGLDCIAVWSGTLFHPPQLPFSIRNLPGDCDCFADKVSCVEPGKPLEVPQSLPPLPISLSRENLGSVGRCRCGCVGKIAAHARDVAVAGERYLTRTEEGALRMIQEYVGRVGRFGSLVQKPSADQCCKCTSARGDSQRQMQKLTCSVLCFQEHIALGVVSPRELYARVGKSLPSHSPRRHGVYCELLVRDFMAFSSLNSENATRGKLAVQTQDAFLSSHN